MKILQIERPGGSMSLHRQNQSISSLLGGHRAKPRFTDLTTTVEGRRRGTLGNRVLGGPEPRPGPAGTWLSVCLFARQGFSEL